MLTVEKKYYRPSGKGVQELHYRFYRDGRVYLKRRGNWLLLFGHVRLNGERMRIGEAILLMFGSPRPSDQHILCHRDDDDSNNDFENLYWGTHATNADDRIRNGHQWYGGNCNYSK